MYLSGNPGITLTIIWSFLCVSAQRKHSRYLWKRWRFPLHPPRKKTREDQCFADLRWAIPKPPPRERRHNEWISTETWRLADTIVSVRREPHRYQSLVCELERKVRAILIAELQCRAERIGTEAEALLPSDPPLVKKAWIRIQGVYRYV